jgi:nitroreductase
MPRACPVEFHDIRYPPEKIALGCHGLVPWRFTIFATRQKKVALGCHGLVPWRFTIAAMVAPNVKLHGPSPWHLIV